MTPNYTASKTAGKITPDVLSCSWFSLRQVRVCSTFRRAAGPDAALLNLERDMAGVVARAAAQTRTDHLGLTRHRYKTPPKLNMTGAL